MLIVIAALAVAVFALSERILREYENGRPRLAWPPSAVPLRR